MFLLTNYLQLENYCDSLCLQDLHLILPRIEERSLHYMDYKYRQLFMPLNYRTNLSFQLNYMIDEIILLHFDFHSMHNDLSHAVAHLLVSHISVHMNQMYFEK